MAAADKFPIVGIGASAGGLEAFETLFRHTPDDTGMAFIIVTHLARGQVSALPEIIGRYTSMPVSAAESGNEIEPNSVHVCPPDHLLMVRGKHLQLQPFANEPPPKPIDVFLASLAEQHAEAAVGILLSGGGSDGTLGIKAIKEHGGLTLAQGGNGRGPLQSAMPDAAIAAGVVDIVLPADAIGPRLANYARDFGKTEVAAASAAAAAATDGYRAVHAILFKQVGHDFSGYKQATFQRRVRRRMQVLQIETLDEYVARLRQDRDEVTALFHDLLIGVTAFFRDPPAFDFLEKKVIPQILERREANATVRIWVPGCATGEEVYSIAILLREQMEAAGQPVSKVQIFATDIDEKALVVARTGRYPESLVANVSKQRLRRFFSSDDISYVINKDIREMCVFSTHSVIRDPPFSRIDLISCRNLLIYLGADFQAQVIPVFHFALKPGGFLFLGAAENIAQFSDLFAPIDKKQRIFQRRENVNRVALLPRFVRLAEGRASAIAERRNASSAANIRRAVEARVLERFAPAHVLVNREGEIIYFSAHTGKYLEPAVGLPSRHVVAMARKGLRVELRNALREAAQTRRPATRERVAVDLDDRSQAANLTIEPLGDNTDDPLFLVLFADADGATAAGEPAPNDDVADKNTERLEQELHDTRDRLEATIEEYETAVEEMKSTNEELQSMNEELQSTNEELETSKEELQSVNEELHTVNSELNAKADEAERVNADLRNVFDATQIATVFLDHDLRIRGFTPAVAGIFNLISGDRGRPLTDIVNHLQDTGNLERDVQMVLEHGNSIERRMRRADGSAHYQVRIMPYRAPNKAIDGALITFVDVTKLVHAEDYQRTLVEELNHRLRNMLSVVGSLANQTLGSTDSPEAFSKAFLGRLQAISASHQLTALHSWDAVSLHAIVASQLRPHLAGKEDHVSIEGPDISFEPRQALSLAVVLHELATNAMRYGALSNAKGRVGVTWSLDGKRLTIKWSERGGPKIGRPRHEGFGTELIERELKSTFGGGAHFAYDAKGVQVEITLAYGSK